jgi:hypothetical protein
MIALAITAIVTVGVLLLAMMLIWSSRKSASERIEMMKLRMAARERTEAEDLDEVQRDVLAAKEKAEAAEVAAQKAHARAEAIARIIKAANPKLNV